jgi:hypothetical protein
MLHAKTNLKNAMPARFVYGYDVAAAAVALSVELAERWAEQRTQVSLATAK